MRTSVQLSITLPSELGRLIKSKVQSGAYASESEVVRDGLRALMARDAALERWLGTEGVARYDASVTDPSRAIPAEKVRVDLEAYMKRRRKRSP
jgi:antitoxin ParD1/3/4